MSEYLTGEQVCTYIAEVYQRVTGKEIDPLDIYNCSPTGELWPVYELYQIAKEVDPLNEAKEDNP